MFKNEGGRGGQRPFEQCSKKQTIWSGRASLCLKMVLGYDNKIIGSCVHNVCGYCCSNIQKQTQMQKYRQQIKCKKQTNLLTTMWSPAEAPTDSDYLSLLRYLIFSVLDNRLLADKIRCCREYMLFLLFHDF